MIKIKETPNADSRTATKRITKNELLEATKLHQKDVSNILEFLISELKFRSETHDHTKLENLDLYHEEFLLAQDKKLNFVDGKFYKLHTDSERHHFFQNKISDVNLIDVLEMLADYSAASLARSKQKVQDIKIDPELLLLAYKNTLKLINENIELEKD